MLLAKTKTLQGSGEAIAKPWFNTDFTVDRCWQIANKDSSGK